MNLGHDLGIKVDQSAVRSDLINRTTLYRSAALILVLPQMPLIYVPETLLPQVLGVLLLSAMAKLCGVKVVTTPVLLVFLFLSIVIFLYFGHIIFGYLGL